MYSGKQVQEPAPICSLQTAFAPQGDGEHGVGFCSIGATESSELLVRSNAN